MRPACVVPIDPSRQLVASLGKAAEVVMPSTFPFEAAEEALDEAVLRGRVRRDEFLRGR
jgi:hypothetical protein